MASFCGECGAALEAGARFCAECGATVEAAQAAAAAPAPVAQPVVAAPPVAAPPPVAPVAAAAPDVAATAVTALGPARYSGFFRRLLALLIDAVLVTVVTTVVPLPDIAKNLAGAVYFVALWSVGGTVGMRVLGIRLIDKDGKSPGPVKALLRAVGWVVSAIPFGLGFLWVAFDGRKQGWHDKIAGTFAARGVFAPSAAAAAPAPASAATPTLAARGGVPKLVVALLVLLVIFSGSAAAAGYYILAPDLPPGGPLAAAPSIDDVKANFPALSGATGPVSTPPPDAVKLRDSVMQQLNLAAHPTSVQDRQMQAQLVSTGLPVTLIARTPLSTGKMAMVVGMDFNKISGGVGTDGGFTDSVNSFVKLAKSSTLNVTQVDHVIVAIHDSQGRVLFGAAAPSAAMLQFRSGQMPQRTFLSKVAIQAESKAGLIDAARRALQDNGPANRR